MSADFLIEFRYRLRLNDRSLAPMGLTPMRRTLSVFTATGLMLAGLALAVFEIARAEGIRPFLLMGAGLMIGAAGLWLTDEFIQMQRSSSQRRKNWPHNA